MSQDYRRKLSRDTYRGPKLPRSLLDKVDGGNVSKRKNTISGRKARRKEERQLKKQPRQAQRPSRLLQAPEKSASPPERAISASPPPTRKTPAKDAAPTKSILKRREPTLPMDELEVSRPSKRKLDEDDAEIAALEKKLGITGKNSKAHEDDGLDWLAGGEDSDDEEGPLPEDQTWMQEKRRRAAAGKKDQALARSSTSSDDDLELDADIGSSDIQSDGDDDEDFEGFESDEGQDPSQSVAVSRSPPKRRENPYVAPVTRDTSTAKYVPPSLRRPVESDEEMLRQLRRQVQGLLNRLSESNMHSILESIEKLYTNNARQYMTSTLIDLLVGLISDASTLNETFLILHAGFSAAVYKVVGTEFGAQLLERVVESIDHFRSRQHTEGKQELNLLAFLCNLYNYQVVGGGLLFDYIRLLLDELSGTNTELLLRVVRTSGQQLRQDDPLSLKDIVIVLNRLVSNAGGQANMSVRTKFMIETIDKLKNNRMKTGAAASALSAEHKIRMKKTLGTLNSRAKAREPIRISLADIRDSEKKGKWWLVGASYHDPAKLANSSTSTTAAPQDDSDTGSDSETSGWVDLTLLAKQQGMNTDVRRAIFISLLGAVEYKDAHIRLAKLNLKNKQRLEIPHVMLKCVGGEDRYNPYYAFVAQKFCNDHKLRKAFQFALWNVFRQIEKAEAGEEAEPVSVRQVVSLAKFFGTLVADGKLSLAVLKKLNFSLLPSKESMFVEVFMTHLLFKVAKKHKGNEEAHEGNVRDLFSKVGGCPDMVVGLQGFIPSTVVGSDLAEKKREKKALDIGCRVAVEALRTVEGTMVESEDESE